MNSVVARAESLFALSFMAYTQNKLNKTLSKTKEINRATGVARNSIGIDVVSIATTFAVSHDAGAPFPWPGCGPGR